ncbi:hypothetical protein HYQ45_007672 [Verticillium longisporum]|uniref:Uncharacterized protein n=1 Tax=Verticillium longisporum TaxID=100787 RepID=A0A8I2ZNV5_VERLO|nr:hypothetical protein HYQ45_007672 [Verticillium longisporum]
MPLVGHDGVDVAQLGQDDLCRLVEDREAAGVGCRGHVGGRRSLSVVIVVGPDENVLEQQRVGVVVRAADDDGEVAPAAYLAYDFVGLALEVADDPGRLVEGDVVEEVVGDAAALDSRHLVGDDGEALVQLHGVGVDDLAAEARREFDGEVGLAGAGRA